MAEVHLRDTEMNQMGHKILTKSRNEMFEMTLHLALFASFKGLEAKNKRLNADYI